MKIAENRLQKVEQVQKYHSEYGTKASSMHPFIDQASSGLVIIIYDYFICSCNIMEGLKDDWERENVKGQEKV